MLNTYGPFSDRIPFWKTIEGSGLLSTPNLILAGDLNLIMSVDEAWGGSGVNCCIDDFFKELFLSHNLVDVKPAKLVPTW
jgi:hypothetical protein